MNCWWFLLCRSSKTLSSSFKFIFCIKMIIFNNRYWILWNKEEIRGYAWFLEFFFLFCFLFLVLFCFFWLFMSIYYSQHWAHYISLMKTFEEFFIYKRMKEREDKQKEWISGTIVNEMLTRGSENVIIKSQKRRMETCMQWILPRWALIFRDN